MVLVSWLFAGLFLLGGSTVPAVEAEPDLEDRTLYTLLAERSFPEGVFALTNDVEVVIERNDSGLTFRIGDRDAHLVEATRENLWQVPELHIAFSGIREAETTLLQLRRYEQTVLLHPAAPGFTYDYEGLSTPEVLADLTPRLMIALNVPGVSISLVEEHELSWLGQFGVKTSDGTERVDAGTVFEAASMSKPAYAYPFLALVENGSMELDVPLVEYLGGDYIEGEELHRLITARMVLTHTTGFPNWRREGELTVGFRPGTDVRYSGEGFQFLQTAVEQVSGMHMEEFSQAYLLRPLGMTSSSFVWQPEYERTYATGHTAAGEPRERRPYTEPNSAYTLYTTPRDYAQILLEVMRADRSAPHSLGAPIIDEMLSPHELPGGESRPLGWRMQRHPTGERFSHSGSNSTGFQCYSEFAPASGNGIVIMTNSSSGGPLWRALMQEIGPI